MKYDTGSPEEAERIATLEQKKHVLEYIVAKNRNGQIGTVEAFVDMGANAIRNASHRRG
jgi:replicative DNA helicase